MKKAISIAVFMILFSSLSFSQGVVTGFVGAFPAGDFADSSRTGVGGYFTVDFELTSAFEGHFSTGFIYFAGTEYLVGDYGMHSIEYTAVPLQLGIKMRSESGFYGLLEAGVHIWTRYFEDVNIYNPVDVSETEIKPGFSAGGGYELYFDYEYALDVAVIYQWLDTHDFIGLRLGVVFVI